MADGALALAPITPSDMAEIRRVMTDMDKAQKRTIRAADHLSVKHALPKTFVGHTIIHENPSQDRLLGLELDRIGHRKTCYLSMHEITRRTFLEKQTRKERKWKSQDEMRINGMNFPTLRASAISGRASVDVMYQSPKYDDGDNKSSEPILPYMRMRRERTEFVRSHGVIATTRLPTVIEIDAGKLQRYNTFCGQDFKRLKTRRIQRDKKFISLLNSLSPLKHEGDSTDRESSVQTGRESIDKSRPWYMSDSDSDSEPELPTRNVSRDSKRKMVVVFPAVAPKRNAVQGKYAAPRQTDLTSGHRLSDDRRPNMDARAHTNYDMQTPDKPGVAFSGVTGKQPPKTAPDLGNVATERYPSPTKFVDLKNAIITELDEQPPRSSNQKTKKGILKSPAKGKRPATKRDKIRRDIQHRDLRELMDKYGHLKSSGVKHNSATNPDPRDETTFHSPTLERRFHVKSSAKYH